MTTCREMRALTGSRGDTSPTSSDSMSDGTLVGAPAAATDHACAATRRGSSRSPRVAGRLAQGAAQNSRLVEVLLGTVDQHVGQAAAVHRTPTRHAAVGRPYAAGRLSPPTRGPTLDRAMPRARLVRRLRDAAMTKMLERLGTIRIASSWPPPSASRLRLSRMPSIMRAGTSAPPTSGAPPTPVDLGRGSGYSIGVELVRRLLARLRPDPGACSTVTLAQRLAVGHPRRPLPDHGRSSMWNGSELPAPAPSPCRARDD